MDPSIFDYKPLTPDQTGCVARLDEALRLAEVSIMALPAAPDEKFFEAVPLIFKALATVVAKEAPAGPIRQNAEGALVQAHMFCMQVRTGYPRTLVSSAFPSTASVLSSLGSAGLWARKAIAMDGREAIDQDGRNDD